MKRNDIALIILIAGFSAILTYVAASTLLSSYTQQSTDVPDMIQISAEIAQPDPEIFNADAINPSVQVNIQGQ